MVSGNGCVQLPINEPASRNSQIQEFRCEPRARNPAHCLATLNIVQAIAIPLCGVSSSTPYYTQLQQQGLLLSVAELEEIAKQQILVDWEKTTPHALLLQTFTQPILTNQLFL